MKRKDKVLAYVLEKTSHLKDRDIEIGGGVTAFEIAESLDILRSNASKDLNTLTREGKLDKTETRPVRYYDATINHYRPLEKKVRSFKEFPSKKENNSKESSSAATDLFHNMIGASGSLTSQISQAKAAIFYPPKGLNTLIIGPTGSGKTYFANAMYQYAQDNKLIAKDKTMVVLNCADYAHNPQLLMSHLFGHVKGAYTGAISSSEGLLEKANHNMLFLDEIHRLPPEGQEMLFYFMDTGSFSPMGDTGEKKKADVRIVCATTEDPNSALLATFNRRIPIVITLPSFQNRPAVEQINLLKYLMSIEAKRIQKSIQIEDKVMQAILGSVTYGNVGQLKSVIQMVCARGFLDSVNNRSEITLRYDSMSSILEDGYDSIALNQRLRHEIVHFLEPWTTITPIDDIMVFDSDTYELPFNLYEIIGDKVAMLKESAVSDQEIHHFITTDIDLHLKSFYKNTIFSTKEDGLKDIVDVEIIELTKKIQQIVEEILQFNFSKKFLYAMSLHISSFVKRIQEGIFVHNNNVHLKEFVLNYQEEQRAARAVKTEIEQYYKIVVPTVEVNYLTMLLVSLRTEEQQGQVGIVIAAHGVSTASSMKEVVATLLNSVNLYAVDMPLEMNPNEAFPKVKAAVEEADNGAGVLYLTDMGSLVTFGQKIMNETGIRIETHDMVTTPMLLEAARKTQFSNQDLVSMSQELKRFRGYSTQKNSLEIAAEENYSLSKQTDKPQIIVTICATGEGTAIQLQKIIEDILAEYLESDISIIPISILNYQEQLKELQKNYTVIATCGSIDPQLQVPFIPIDALLAGNGKHRLHNILEGIESEGEQKILPRLSKEICVDYMSQYVTYINPAKIITPVWDFCYVMEKQLDQVFENAFNLGIMLHLCGMLERIITREEIHSGEDVDEVNPKLALLIEENIAPVLYGLNLEVSKNELKFVGAMYQNKLKEKQV
ncbi:sigma-54-dependent transcriptional regulator [Desemzia sp. FAM 23991]|uniref:sigma-54-dependent transcriptional regulator n=1 Tax=unclassified Desemzia TaxID=2685243 RepID=UPI0038877E62